MLVSLSVSLLISMPGLRSALYECNSRVLKVIERHQLVTDLTLDLIVELINIIQQKANNYYFLEPPIFSILHLYFYSLK